MSSTGAKTARIPKRVRRARRKRSILVAVSAFLSTVLTALGLVIVYAMMALPASPKHAAAHEPPASGSAVDLQQLQKE